MPDPVPPRPLLYRLRDASRSFTDLRSAHARAQRLERDELGNPWHKVDANSLHERDSLSDVDRQGTPESMASPRSVSSPDDKRGKIPSPLSFRPRALSNASDSGRVSRAQKSKQAAEGAPAVPPLPATIAPQIERVQWPCRQWLPRLGPSGRTALALPVEPWAQEALPPTFDSQKTEALRVLVLSQCSPSRIEQFASQGPEQRAAMQVAARFLGLHCLEKREQLKREHARAERDLQSLVDWRQGLLRYMQRLSEAGCDLSEPLREVSNKRLGYFACLWADEEVLALLLSQSSRAFPFQPFFETQESSVSRFCRVLRSKLHDCLPELEALSGFAARNDAADVSACYRQVVRAFAAQFHAPAPELSGYAEPLLLRGLYFFCYIAIRSNSSAMLEGALLAGQELSREAETSKVALRLCLKEGFFAGAALCLRPEFRADVVARVLPEDGVPILDFQLPAGWTPMHELAALKYRDGLLQQRDAIKLVEKLHDAGADARALALVKVDTRFAKLEHDTLASAGTLALMHNNVELAIRMGQLARRRDHQEKMSAAAELAGEKPATTTWRRQLLADVHQQLSLTKIILEACRTNNQGPDNLQKMQSDWIALFDQVGQAFRQVFSFNLERGFGLHDTGEVRFLHALSLLLQACEQTHESFRPDKQHLGHLHEAHVADISRCLQQSLDTLTHIDLHRSDVDQQRGGASIHRDRQRELFDEGASNLQVLREHDRFGTLRPLPLLATVSSPGEQLYRSYVAADRAWPTFDCVAAFGLSLSKPSSPDPSSKLPAMPALAKQMLESFDVSRSDWDVVLTAFLLAAVRQRHVKATQMVLGCAERVAGGADRLPLEQIDVLPALMMAAPVEVLQALVNADKTGRWMNTWRTQASPAGETLLHLAARQDDQHVSVLSRAAREGMRKLASAPDACGRTPLHTALECGNLQAASCLWELQATLAPGLRPSSPMVIAFLRNQGEYLRALWQLPKNERLRSVVVPALLTAAIWRDDRAQLEALFRNIDGQYEQTFPNGENLLHAISRSNAFDCLQWLSEQQNFFSATGSGITAELAERPDHYGRLPDAICLTEGMATQLRHHRQLRVMGRADGFDARPTPLAISRRRQASMGHSPQTAPPSFLVTEPLMLSVRPQGASPEETAKQALRQRQAVLLLLRQKSASKRDQLVDDFLRHPHWPEWARSTGALQVDPCHRDNLAWEIVRALDDIEGHKAFGVRLAAQMPGVSTQALQTRVQHGAPCAGRFSCHDGVALLELRQRALRLCRQRRGGLPGIEPAVDMELILSHPKLQAVLAQPSVKRGHVVLSSTNVLRFVLRKGRVANEELQVLDMHLVAQTSVQPSQFGQLTPVYGPTSA